MTEHYVIVKRYCKSHFPIDMLRKDQLRPATPSDSRLIEKSFSLKETITEPIVLITEQDFHWEPSRDEWSLRCWPVIGHDIGIQNERLSK